MRALLASTANAKKFITGGGLQMLLSLLTTVHMESERSAHSQVLQSNLLNVEGGGRGRVEGMVCATDPSEGGG